MSQDALPTDSPSPQRPVRCAMYVRVSVDERQDSEMPSVVVQAQACRAYIESRKHQGWRVTLYPEQMAIRWDLHGLAKLLREMMPEPGDGQTT